MAPSGKNTMYLYGKNSVAERLKVNPRSIRRIFLQNNFNDHELLGRIRACRIPVENVSEKTLTNMKRADRLQGIVAAVDSYNYTPFEDILGSPRKYTLCAVDNLNDPHNLGSVLRIAACFGGFAVVIPKHSACEVTDTVIHVASGGENFVPVSMVTNLSTALIEAKQAGYWIAGATVQDGEDITRVKLPFPLCLVLGSEGKGIRHGIDKQLEMRVRIPMEGAALSFNVAMAAAIFCYEIKRQRHQ
ncbi:MAG: 23S rRNA (guanosine(2251)-2'-O)-methyltransferase RlmB [Candidatus Omnitrophica bacterium]|nr:23S rRNA (guanosine(2251)-2'-O)-methyltransferase RlmB [Candidatus Omnitrophota bacterium]